LFGVGRWRSGIGLHSARELVLRHRAVLKYLCQP
jgi:hypothetical protein